MRAHWLLPKRTARSKQTLTEFRLSLQAEKGTNRAMFRRGEDFGDPLAQIRERTTQNNRSFLFNLGTPFLLLSTPSCCRKARFSRAKLWCSLRAARIRIPSHCRVSIMGWSVEGTG
jgi:hypothetical protein